MLKDTNKYIKDVVSTRVKNILYYIIYVFEPRIIEMHGRNNIGGCWQSPPQTNFEKMRCTKKNIMGVKIMNVSKIKIKSHILKLMKV
jgi:hypothetical protein